MSDVELVGLHREALFFQLPALARHVSHAQPVMRRQLRRIW